MYSGAAEDAAERLPRHIRNLAGARGLSLRDLYVTVVPLPSAASALYAERLVQDRLRPLFCQPALAGLGSRPQGTVRQRGQRPSPFDCLHPRPWAVEATTAEKRAAFAALADYLSDPGRPRGIWPPLRAARRAA